jgi:transcriptional regulator GlxA family with amidase domain
MELCVALIEEDFGAQIGRAIAPCLPVRPGKSQYVAPEDLSPAEAEERSRAEAALQRVREGREPFEAIARGTGFKDAEEMRRGFLRFFGQPPQALRRAARVARKAQDRRKIAWPPAENSWDHPANRPDGH